MLCTISGLVTFNLAVFANSNVSTLEEREKQLNAFFDNLAKNGSSIPKEDIIDQDDITRTTPVKELEYNYGTLQEEKNTTKAYID